MPLTMLNRCKLMTISGTIDYFIVVVVCMGLCEFMGIDNDPSSTWPPCPCSYILVMILICLHLMAERKLNIVWILNHLFWEY